MNGKARWIAIAGAAVVLISQGVLLLQGDQGGALAIIYALAAAGTLLAKEPAGVKIAFFGGVVLNAWAWLRFILAERAGSTSLWPVVVVIGSVMIVLAGRRLWRDQKAAAE